MSIKVIITGATGMVGEGALFECLEHPEVEQVLLVNRKSYGSNHAKVKELIVPDFMTLDAVESELSSYDACFFCAGISSVGMKEEDYRRITYDITLHFAETLASLNPDMVFDYVSGAGTDSTERGRQMWARVKGKTENDLLKLPFKAVYNFRPGFMKATLGQKQLKSFYKIIGWLYPLLSRILPNITSTLKVVGQAMINSVLKGYPQPVLEVKDIKALAASR